MTEKSSKWNSLLPRLLTAAVGGALVVFLLVFKAITSFFVLSVIGMGCLWEFYQIAKKSGLSPNIKVGLVGGIFLFASLFFHFKVSILLLLILFVLASIELLKVNQNIIASLSSTLLGLIYCIGPMLLLMKVSTVRGGYDWRIIIALLVMIWSFDSGAYFAGKLLGKHKMIPKVSPGKTWEGTIGGSILCFVGVYLFSHLYSFFSLAECIAYSLKVSVCGTFGDLLVSQMKRNIDLKDTGNLLPGHGGFLDRFDGFLMAASFYGAVMLFL